MYFNIIISAIAIFTLFRILTFLNKTLPLYRGLKHYVTYLLPVIELAAWMAFVVWCVTRAYRIGGNIALIISTIIALLLILPVGFLLRDFLYGVFLKLQRKIVENEYIEVEDIHGVVLNAGHFSFDLRTPEGNINTIPYHKIRFKIISKPSVNINLIKQLISFEFPRTQEINQVLTALRITLTNAPWVAISQDPIIKEVRQENNYHKIEVIVYTLNNEHLRHIKEYALKNMSDFLA